MDAEFGLGAAAVAAARSWRARRVFSRILRIVTAGMKGHVLTATMMTSFRCA